MAHFAQKIGLSPQLNTPYGLVHSKKRSRAWNFEHVALVGSDTAKKVWGMFIEGFFSANGSVLFGARAVCVVESGFGFQGSHADASG